MTLVKRVHCLLQLSCRMILSFANSLTQLVGFLTDSSCAEVLAQTRAILAGMETNDTSKFLVRV